MILCPVCGTSPLRHNHAFSTTSCRCMRSLVQYFEAHELVLFLHCSPIYGTRQVPYIRMGRGDQLSSWEPDGQAFVPEAYRDSVSSSVISDIVGLAAVDGVMST